jgi:hypothetical protein
VQCRRRCSAARLRGKLTLCDCRCESNGASASGSLQLGPPLTTACFGCCSRRRLRGSFRSVTSQKRPPSTSPQASHALRPAQPLQLCDLCTAAAGRSAPFCCRRCIGSPPLNNTLPTSATPVCLPASQLAVCVQGLKPGPSSGRTMHLESFTACERHSVSTTGAGPQGVLLSAGAGARTLQSC